MASKHLLIVQRAAGDHTAVVEGDQHTLALQAVRARDEMCPPSFPGRQPKHRAKRIRIVRIESIIDDWTSPD